MIEIKYSSRVFHNIFMAFLFLLGIAVVANISICGIWLICTNGFKAVYIIMPSIGVVGFIVLVITILWYYDRFKFTNTDKEDKQ